jgi:hypothetical protein
MYKGFVVCSFLFGVVAGGVRRVALRVGNGLGLNPYRKK